jgi:hypothetical protein
VPRARHEPCAQARARAEAPARPRLDRFGRGLRSS